jgi:hypothetical protein
MSIASAPASNTGRSSCRQTACVTVVPEMAAKIRDLFQADAATREQPHEAVPEVSRRPVLRIQISPRQDRPERSSDIRSIETAADQAGKHEVAVLPGATRTLPLSTLGNPVTPERVNTALRQRERSSRLLGLGIAARSDRSPDPHGWWPRRHRGRVSVEVDEIPGQGSEFFSSGAHQNGQHDVRVNAGALG